MKQHLNSDSAGGGEGRRPGQAGLDPRFCDIVAQLRLCDSVVLENKTTNLVIVWFCDSQHHNITDIWQHHKIGGPGRFGLASCPHRLLPSAQVVPRWCPGCAQAVSRRYPGGAQAVWTFWFPSRLGKHVDPSGGVYVMYACMYVCMYVCIYLYSVFNTWIYFNTSGHA